MLKQKMVPVTITTQPVAGNHEAIEPFCITVDIADTLCIARLEELNS